MLSNKKASVLAGTRREEAPTVSHAAPLISLQTLTDLMMEHSHGRDSSRRSLRGCSELQKVQGALKGVHWSSRGPVNVLQESVILVFITEVPVIFKGIFNRFPQTLWLSSGP